MRTLIAMLVAALAASSVQAQSGIACTVTMSSGLFSFGSFVPISPVGVSTLLGEFSVRCANSGKTASNVRLRLAISAGASGTTAQRHMTRPGATVPLLYNLYEDATYTTVWTATTGGRPDENLNVPAGATAELRRQVFGRIPGSQTLVTVGRYSDVLVAEVRY
jgi:spore coat protein U-like protein